MIRWDEAAQNELYGKTRYGDYRILLPGPHVGRAGKIKAGRYLLYANHGHGESHVGTFRSVEAAKKEANVDSESSLHALIRSRGYENPLSSPTKIALGVAVVGGIAAGLYFALRKPVSPAKPTAAESQLEQTLASDNLGT